MIIQKTPDLLNSVVIITSGPREPKIPEKTKKVLREIALLKKYDNIIPIRAPFQNNPKLYKNIKTHSDKSTSSNELIVHSNELFAIHNISPAMHLFKISILKETRPIAILNITNMLQFADIPYAKLWREQNINIALKNDIYKLLYFPDERTEEQNIKIKPHATMNAVQISGSFLEAKISDNYNRKYDIIFMSMIKHEHKNPNNEHETLLLLLTAIIKLPDMLHIGGEYTAQIGKLWSFLANDLLHILAELFDEVIIVPAPFIIRYKNVLCRGYNGKSLASMNIYKAIRDKSIHRLLKSCDLRQFREMQYEESINTLEIRKQAIYNVLHKDSQMSVNAKIQAMQIYENAGVPVPFLLTKKDMKMDQVDAVIIQLIKNDNITISRPADFEDRLRAIEQNLYMSKRRIDMISDLQRYNSITDMLNVSTKLKKNDFRNK